MATQSYLPLRNSSRQVCRDQTRSAWRDPPFHYSPTASSPHSPEAFSRSPCPRRFSVVHTETTPNSFARWAIRHGDLERPLLDAATASWLDNTGNTGAAADTKRKSDRNKDKMRDLMRGGGRGENAGTASAITLPSVGGSSETASATTAGKADDGSWSSSMKRDMRVSVLATQSYIGRIRCGNGSSCRSTLFYF